MKRLKILIVLVMFILCSNTAKASTFNYSATKERTQVYWGNVVVKDLPKSSVVEILEWGEEWTTIVYDSGDAKIKTKSLLKGDAFIDFIRDNPVHTKSETEVKYNNVRVVSNPNNGKLITVIGKQSDIRFVESFNNGYSSVLLDGKLGYVSNTSIKVKYTIRVPKYVNNNYLRDRIVDSALPYVGNKYVWGGTSLVTGADCSGFVRAILSLQGIWIPRVSIDQSKWGKEVPLNEVRPGDLIFYMRDGQIGHVGMYIGDGKIIQALNSRVGTIISSMYFATPIKAMNVIGD